MDGAIRVPASVGHGRASSGLLVIAVGVIVGVALGLFWNTLREGNVGGNVGEIGPFGAPTELCRFNTFNQSVSLAVSARHSAMPAMASRCDYLFKERQYVQVGYRI